MIAGSYRSPSFEHALVSDAMRSGVITCPPDASLRAVARTMAMNHVHSVVVTAGGEAPDQDGRPPGVLSALDVAGVLAWGLA